MVLQSLFSVAEGANVCAEVMLHASRMQANLACTRAHVDTCRLEHTFSGAAVRASCMFHRPVEWAEWC